MLFMLETHLHLLQQICQFVTDAAILPPQLTTAVYPVVKVEMQRWGNCNFRLWSPVGSYGPLIDGF